MLKYLSYSPTSFNAGKKPFKGNDAGKFLNEREYLAILAARYHQARLPSSPSIPKTIPDSVISIILENFYEIDPSRLEQVSQEHALSMSAENIVGHLLERYIAEHAEPRGWAWAAGSFVKAVDFVMLGKDMKWKVLQVKNRDNSENSSSSQVRTGTEILHWFRTYSARDATNWENFPDLFIAKAVSEEGFKAFVVQYLNKLKAQA